MAEISIRLAKSAADIAAAQALCRDWLDWHWRHYPSDWEIGPDHPMDRDRFEAIVQDLEALHARPQGGIVLGFVDGAPCGCVMYRGDPDDPTAAEFNRMFVREAAGGHSLGRRMLEQMCAQMTADGYRRVFFSSARLLTHAKAMYEAAGFGDMPYPPGFPEHLKDRAYFMERRLD